MTDEEQKLRPMNGYFYRGPITYRCHWPGCEYHTQERNQIELHHIIPRELGVRLNCHVTLSFCPTHHRLIWHPESRHGHHSIKGDNKLMIHHIYPAAPNGYAVEYENMQGYKWFEFFEGDYRTGEDENNDTK